MCRSSGADGDRHRVNESTRPRSPGRLPPVPVSDCPSAHHWNRTPRPTHGNICVLGSVKPLRDYRLHVLFSPSAPSLSPATRDRQDNGQFQGNVGYAGLWYSGIVLARRFDVCAGPGAELQALY